MKILSLHVFSLSKFTPWFQHVSYTVFKILSVGLWENSSSNMFFFYIQCIMKTNNGNILHLFCPKRKLAFVRSHSYSNRISKAPPPIPAPRGDGQKRTQTFAQTWDASACTAALTQPTESAQRAWLPTGRVIPDHALRYLRKKMSARQLLFSFCGNTKNKVSMAFFSFFLSSLRKSKQLQNENLRFTQLPSSCNA